MMINATIEKLKSLRLAGMLLALEEQLKTQDIAQMSFEERFGLIVDREEILRQEKSFQRKIKTAKLRERQACLEDIDYKAQRSLSKSTVLTLSHCQWIQKRQDLIITGPTGIGKSYLACALAHRACQNNFSSLYFRAPKLFQQIAITKADGRYPKLMNSIAKTDLLIIDDFGISPLTAEDARDFLEIVEDRHKSKSMILTSQLPLDKWFAIIGNATIADAIMDRIVNNAHKIELKGKSMRKEQSSLTLAHDQIINSNE